MKLDRTRVIFLAIVGLTGVVICGALALNIFNNANGSATTTTDSPSDSGGRGHADDQPAGGQPGLTGPDFGAELRSR